MMNDEPVFQSAVSDKNDLAARGDPSNTERWLFFGKRHRHETRDGHGPDFLYSLSVQSNST